MIILVLEHSIPSIKGYVTRHLIEIKSGVYAGALSNSRRNVLWEHIIKEQPNIDAIMVYEEGKHIRLMSNGCPSRKVVNINGVNFMARVSNEKKMHEKMLAKLDPDKTVMSHSYETGWTVGIILTDSIFSSLLTFMSKAMGLDKEKALSTIQFICAIHDIGKLAPAFNEKFHNINENNATINDIRKELVDYGIVDPGSPYELLWQGWRHEKYGYKLIARKISSVNGHILPFNKKTLRNIAKCIGEHHQKSTFDSDNNESDYKNISVNNDDEKKWINDVIIPAIKDISNEFPAYDFVINKDYSVDVFL